MLSLIRNLDTKLDELFASGPAGKTSETRRIRDCLGYKAGLEALEDR
jgi:hypothetical protein